MKPEISVIIPNWNGKKYLKTCFDSLRNQTFKDFEIILVDNGSEDGSIEFIKSNYPEVRIIALSENYGFSKAVNLGIKEAKGEYIALLNNDTETHSEWLKNLCVVSKKYPRYHFFASKILCFDQRDKIDSAGDCLDINGVAYRRGHYEKDSQKFNEEKEIFGPCGAAAFYKKDLFDQIGYFDEDFFAFYEDVDLNFRAQLAGFKCMYIPSAVIYHIGHGSWQDNGWVAFLHRRNQIFTLFKNMPLGLCLRYFRKIIWFRLCWAFKDLIKMIIRYKYDKSTEIRMKARFAVFKDFIKMYKKRRFIQKNRQISLRYLESIL
jgi:GT2 family glycosyltransferase